MWGYSIGSIQEASFNDHIVPSAFKICESCKLQAKPGLSQSFIEYNRSPAGNLSLLKYN